MRHQNMVVVALFLILLGPILAAPALAQDPGRGTTLVCTGRGGNGLMLDEWTPQQVADFEDRSGRDVVAIAVPPATGDCFDLADVQRWFPGTLWLCTPVAEGTWRGPSKVWPMFRSPYWHVFASRWDRAMWRRSQISCISSIGAVASLSGKSRILH